MSQACSPGSGAETPINPPPQIPWSSFTKGLPQFHSIEEEVAFWRSQFRHSTRNYFPPDRTPHADFQDEINISFRSLQEELEYYRARFAYGRTPVPIPRIPNPPANAKYPLRRSHDWQAQFDRSQARQETNESHDASTSESSSESQLPPIRELLRDLETREAYYGTYGGLAVTRRPDWRLPSDNPYNLSGIPVIRSGCSSPVAMHGSPQSTASSFGRSGSGSTNSVAYRSPSSKAVGDNVTGEGHSAATQIMPSGTSGMNAASKCPSRENETQTFNASVSSPPGMSTRAWEKSKLDTAPSHAHGWSNYWTCLCVRREFQFATGLHLN